MPKPVRVCLSRPSPHATPMHRLHDAAACQYAGATGASCATTTGPMGFVSGCSTNQVSAHAMRGRHNAGRCHTEAHLTKTVAVSMRAVVGTDHRGQVLSKLAMLRSRSLAAALKEVAKLALHPNVRLLGAGTRAEGQHPPVNELPEWSVTHSSGLLHPGLIAWRHPGPNHEAAAVKHTKAHMQALNDVFQAPPGLCYGTHTALEPSA